MRAVVQSAEDRFGPIQGVIHAAGLLGTSLLPEKSLEEVESILRPKVEGTMVLDSLFAARKLDFFLLCSSVSGAFGSPGMTDYSSANAFLDAFAQSGAARSSARVQAICWDMWRDVGFAATESGETHPALRMGIRPDEGVEALRRVMATAMPRVFVAKRSMADLLHKINTLIRWMRGEMEPESTSTETASAQQDLQAARHERPDLGHELVPPSSPEEEQLVSIWSELLGIEPIGVNDDFFELGGHSLLATRVLSRVSQAFNVKLPIRVIFDAPTIAKLAEQVRTAAWATRQATPQTADAAEAREEIEL